MPTINFIGCGRLGKTIARLITIHNLGEIKGILNSTTESAILASKFIGQGVNVSAIKELPHTDIYFITTRDNLIEVTCNKLVTEAKPNKGSVIVHCSGSLSSDTLQKAREIGCHVISVHPIKSFANPEMCIADFSGTYCAYEGDQKAIPFIEAIFKNIGGILLPIKKEQKTLYHAAAILANNYLVGLHHTAVECYKLSGVNEDTAYKVTSMLMKDALHNLQSSNHVRALTGPLQRGDIEIIKKHLSALHDSPIIKNVYKTLGTSTISITEHPDKLKGDLIDLFEEKNANSTPKCKL